MSEPAFPLRYLLVWAALVALTVTTFLLSYVPLGALQLPAAMLIAATKGALVVFVFMHLWKHPVASRLALLLALFFIGVLMSGALADVATRPLPAVPVSPGSESRESRLPP